jgi:ATP-dependent Lon protease
MKTIQEELGGVSQRGNGEMLAKSKPRNGTRKRKRISKIVKMRRMNPQAPDFGIQRNYLELLLELPWNEYSKDNFDLKEHKDIG